MDAEGEPKKVGVRRVSTRPDMLSPLLRVALREPQRLVERARKGREKIRRVGVTPASAVSSMLARTVLATGNSARSAHRDGWSRYRCRSGRARDWWLGQLPGCAERSAAELDDPLRHRVDMTVEFQCGSRRSFRAMRMKFGPLRFQCACLVRSARSIDLQAAR